EVVLEPVLTAEARLGRHFVSPYRPSLIRFLSCCPEKTVEHLLEKLNSLMHVRFFCALLRSASGAPFRAALIARTELMLAKGVDQGRAQGEAATGQPTAAIAASSTLLFNSIAVLRAVSVHSSDFLAAGTPTAERLCGLLAAPVFATRMQHEEILS